ncbi:MAG: type IV pilus modification protein PilV [Gammaproteobacteria bacterium]|nr:type IV pilus modification protein PilV [Gammaproteobacteria bacterium]
MKIQKQSGFGLIEVLLAFLILSIGLLGVAGLQTTAVKASHTAMIRTIAVTKVQEIIERIRANSSAAVTSYAQVRGGALSIGANNNCDGAAPVECSPALLAANDIYSWGWSLVNAGLPATGTEAAITVDTTVVPPVTTISVYWKERGENMFYETMIHQ